MDTAFWWCGIIWRAKVANLELPLGTDTAMLWVIWQSIFFRHVSNEPVSAPHKNCFALHEAVVVGSNSAELCVPQPSSNTETAC